MKLFIYDEKHERVNGELDLGDISDTENQLLEKVIAFLDKENITDRYGSLELANGYSYYADFEDEFPVVLWE
jgi:hypothetical protein